MPKTLHISHGSRTFALLLALGLLTVTITAVLTEKPIQHNQQQAQLAQIQQLLPDHTLTIDQLKVLNAQNKLKLGRLTLQKYQVPGYSGPLNVLTVIDTKARIIRGVRVLPPIQETPGLGDVIDHQKSDWITQFAGRSTLELSVNNFDSISGATISTQAVINAVAQHLLQPKESH